MADSKHSSILAVPTPVKSQCAMPAVRKSCGKGMTQVNWELSDCDQVAREIFKLLPEEVHQMLSKPFKGKLVSLDNDIANPNHADVRRNYPIVQPMLKMWPMKVPSRYAVCDAGLALT